MGVGPPSSPPSSVSSPSPSETQGLLDLGLFPCLAGAPAGLLPLRAQPGLSLAGTHRLGEEGGLCTCGPSPGLQLSECSDHPGYVQPSQIYKPWCLGLSIDSESAGRVEIKGWGCRTWKSFKAAGLVRTSQPLSLTSGLKRQVFFRKGFSPGSVLTGLWRWGPQRVCLQLAGLPRHPNLLPLSPAE